MFLPGSEDKSLVGSSLHPLQQCNQDGHHTAYLLVYSGLTLSHFLDIYIVYSGKCTATSKLKVVKQTHINDTNYSTHQTHIHDINMTVHTTHQLHKYDSTDKTDVHYTNTMVHSG